MNSHRITSICHTENNFKANIKEKQCKRGEINEECS